MEKRSRNADNVVRSQFLVQSDMVSVIADAYMAEHNPFRKTGRAGSVLHVCSIIRAEAVLPFLKFFFRDGFCKFPYFRHAVHAVLLFFPEKNNAFEVGELFALYIFFVLRFDFRSDLAECGEKIMLAVTFRKADVFTFGLLELI